MALEEMFEIEFLDDLDEMPRFEEDAEQAMHILDSSWPAGTKRRTIDEVDDDTKKKRKRTTRRRLEFFSSDDKRQLAAEVKKRPVLWDLSHKDHNNGNAVKSSWRKIGAALLRTG
ncbi:uncharacterized protein LOC110677887 [Aedes aegypti]|uniref:Uncharacterized protein n=1 Tax=Aedes aegypti TaxID=7159 RepID=A0A6I8U8J5_AEDAE|nr:uncharacterized protein LOC110677887 [Aedes aegypti]